ncbi:MAG: endolytic transglycosylase MltG [Gammaproteobacteria bacterium]|nr:endolytic transglycosylase MltG [Gammaproteobacteria bacterium]
MRMITAIVLMLAIVVAAGLLGQQRWQGFVDGALPIDSDTTYVIEPGTPVLALANDLQRHGWIDRPNWFVWLARLQGDTARIRAGEFAVPAGATPRQLLEVFTGTDVVQHSFTIIEGSTFAEIRASLQETEAIALTLDPTTTDAKVMTQIGLAGLHPEGQFLPETYYFTRGTTDADLLRRAHRAMRETLEELWPQRAADIPLDTPYEALIMASIIEKETALDSEREQISGVFARRLKTGMRLQSDPTIIYGMGDNYDGDIRRRDLTNDTPYNTYTRNGLPPTPIAMPGRASIAAALNPAPGSALFFVATGNGDGSHHFSATLAEHNRAVQRYLTKLRQRP